MNGFKTGRLFEPKTLSLNEKVYEESVVVFGRYFEIQRFTWISINRKKGHWRYTSSGNKLKFQNWVKKQPGRNDRNCVYMWHQPTGIGRIIRVKNARAWFSMDFK